MVESAVSVLVSGRPVLTSGISVLISGRLRRVVREVYGNTLGMRTRGVPRVLMECHESELLSRLVLHGVHCSCIRMDQATSLFAVAGLSRLLLRLVFISLSTMSA